MNEDEGTEIFKLCLKYKPCFRMTMNQYMSRTSQILLAAFSFAFLLLLFCHDTLTSIVVKLQLHCLEKNGKQITKMVSYCSNHK